MMNPRLTDWFNVMILGIVEGITEFLPISSTGHLLLLQHWMPSQSDLFNIVIQSGAVLAVLPLFPERLRQVCFGWREGATQIFILKIGVAFVITGIGGYLLERGGFRLPDTVAPVAIALLIGGVLFIGVERRLKGRSVTEDITWAIVVAVGVGQLIAAVFPGASRSGTTILLALMMGLSRPAATEFSFLVGIPTMLAAGGLKIVTAGSDASEAGPKEDWAMVAWGFVVSAVVSFIAVKWLLGYVRSHTFEVFGWYRIALGALILLIVGR